MSINLKNETTLKLGGTELVMRPTMGCIMNIEKLTGKDIVQHVNDVQTMQIGMADIVTILVEGTKAAGSAVSMETITVLYDEFGKVPIQEQLVEFLTGALYGGPAYEEFAKKKDLMEKKIQKALVSDGIESSA